MKHKLLFNALWLVLALLNRGIARSSSPMRSRSL